jgi:hypothetical protein
MFKNARTHARHGLLPGPYWTALHIPGRVRHQSVWMGSAWMRLPSAHHPVPPVEEPVGRLRVPLPAGRVTVAGPERFSHRRRPRPDAAVQDRGVHLLRPQRHLSPPMTSLASSAVSPYARCRSRRRAATSCTARTRTRPGSRSRCWGRR